jgi:hypothetical protein
MTSGLAVRAVGKPVVTRRTSRRVDRDLRSTMK